MDMSGLPPVPISELLGGMLIMVCGSFVYVFMIESSEHVEILITPSVDCMV